MTNSTYKNSKIFLNIDNFGCQKFKNRVKQEVITYSIKQTADYCAKNIEYDELSSSFDIYKANEKLGEIELIIPGEHNVYNALAVVCVLDRLGYKFDDYKKHFKTFSGMGRRFQFIAQTKGVKIIDDYAHHPNEIKSTLNAIKNYKKRKVVIFQPHRYTRLKALWDEFLDSFNTIDKLYLVDVFTAGDKFDVTYNSKNFASEISKKGIDAKYVEGTIKEAGKKIAPELKENDLLLTLGAGDITEIGGVINDILAK